MRRRPGFTLIELLVVIAIIAILAAILFPVFAKAREKARQSSCLSNLKQLNLGMLAYAQDYDERMPFYPYGPDPWLYTWPITIQSYVSNWNLLSCPSNPHTATLTYHGQTYPGYPDYALSNWWHRNSRALAESTNPASHYLMSEACHFVLGDYRIAWPRTCGTCGSGACNGDLALRNDDNAGHSAGDNIGFVDGHVKWMKWTTVYDRFNDLYNGNPF